MSVPTRPALFANALSRDLKSAAETMENDLISVRVAAENLLSLPRRVDTGAVAQISNDVADAVRRLDGELRKLREVVSELRDFVR
jgi:hypothetical protein